MTKSWHVSAGDAYQRWCERHSPTEAEELELSSWLAACEDDGPPPIVTEDGENKVAIGPYGGMVAFRVFETTEADSVTGYIYVLDID